jgi:pimeloyl-ACP methyl ester carboxylesterase
MDAGQITERGIWVGRGGSGDRLLVLLHGLGANATVWDRMLPLIEASWNGRWIAPDFRGHGRSIQQGPYGFGMHAADIAELIGSEQASHVTIAGHSFGGVIAALVATGWFGPRVHDVAAFGVKIEWTADETNKLQELSKRPARTFATREEAIDRYLKGSGLIGLVDPSAPTAAVGVTGTDGDYRVAMDPRAYSAVGPSVEAILRLADAPLRLAAGSKDPMVTLDQMRRIDPAAQMFDGVGHNAHWEAPERVWSFVSSSRSQRQ